MSLTVDQKIALLVVIAVPIGVLTTFLNGPYFHSPGQHLKKFLLSVFAFIVSFSILASPLIYWGIFPGATFLRSLLGFGAPASPTPAPVTPPALDPAASLPPDAAPHTSALPSAGLAVKQPPINPVNSSPTRLDDNVRPDLVKFWLKQGFNSKTKKDIPVLILAPDAEIQYKDKFAAKRLSELLGAELNIVYNRLDAAIIVEISKVYFNGNYAPNRDCPSSTKTSAWDGQAGVTVRMAWNGGREFFILEDLTDSRLSCDQDTAANAALEAVLAKIKERILAIASSEPQSN